MPSLAIFVLDRLAFWVSLDLSDHLKPLSIVFNRQVERALPKSKALRFTWDQKILLSLLDYLGLFTFLVVINAIEKNSNLLFRRFMIDSWSFRLLLQGFVGFQEFFVFILVIAWVYGREAVFFFSWVSLFSLGGVFGVFLLSLRLVLLGGYIDCCNIFFLRTHHLALICLRLLRLILTFMRADFRPNVHLLL